MSSRPSTVSSLLHTPDVDYLLDPNGLRLKAMNKEPELFLLSKDKISDVHQYFSVRQKCGEWRIGWTTLD
jgi:hypothetical protein